MSFLDTLNEAQRNAVVNTDGPVIIVAGPGSGKTRVLTYRIAYLLKMKRDEHDRPIDAFSVLALTFTNKAAKEMRERVEHVVGLEARNLYIGTFHSVFARILRYEAQRIGYPSNFSIYDTDDSRSLLKSIIKEMGLNDTYYKPNVVHNRISAAKNKLMTPEAYAMNFNLRSEDESSGKPRLADIFKTYNERMFQAGAMDFDDLLVKMYELLIQVPEALYRYQNRFKYILIDEFQDTNYAQNEIVKKLAAVHENITVVGDDAQSIYSFRGATIENILRFRSTYPEAREYKLEQNYRSTQHIVKAANTVIRKNRNQIPKEIWTENNGGERIKVFKAVSDNDEGRIIVDKIFEERMRSQRHNRDFAILYRTNAQSRAFEEALRRLNIPYIIYGGLSFYQRKEVKDLVAYLRLTVNHYDEEALKRIINYPTRGIGNTTMERAALVAKENSLRLWDVLEQSGNYMSGNRSLNAVNDFVTMIKSFALELQTKNAFDLAAHIARASGLHQELYNDKTVEGLSRYENLQELLNGIREFTETETPEITADGEVFDTMQQDKSLGRWLQEITLLTDADKDNGDDDKVKLMTIHAAKGLEFPCVFVVGMEENLFPSMMSLDSRDDLEEERRLFYVAITRAKEKLCLSFSVSRYRYGNLMYCEPSRFLREINEENLEFTFSQVDDNSRHIKREPVQKTTGVTPKAVTNNYVHKPADGFVADDASAIQVGMDVEHQRFGFGKVMLIEGGASDRMATIFFQNGVGNKKLMLKFAKLRIVNRNTFSLN
jgi:DNA helicase-2/ATP-dependent DNA helicase PcrA